MCRYKITAMQLLLAITMAASGQKVFSVQYPNQADVKVYVVKYENQADLKVFKVEYENQADLKIYFVEYENQAGWRNKEKIHLMF